MSYGLLHNSLGHAFLPHQLELERKVRPKEVRKRIFEKCARAQCPLAADGHRCRATVGRELRREKHILWSCIALSEPRPNIKRSLNELAPDFRLCAEGVELRVGERPRKPNMKPAVGLGHRPFATSSGARRADRLSNRPRAWSLGPEISAARYADSVRWSSPSSSSSSPSPTKSMPPAWWSTRRSRSSSARMRGSSRQSWTWRTRSSRCTRRPK